MFGTIAYILCKTPPRWVPAALAADLAANPAIELLLLIPIWALGFMARAYANASDLIHIEEPSKTSNSTISPNNAMHTEHSKASFGNGCFFPSCPVMAHVMPVESLAANIGLTASVHGPSSIRCTDPPQANVGWRCLNPRPSFVDLAHSPMDHFISRRLAPRTNLPHANQGVRYSS